MATKRINSRTKGSKNERDLAKLFQKWTKKDFARTPSSGGLNWKSSNSKGDIVCTTEGHYFPFCIEAKNHREINFEHLLYLPKPKILEFWAQCKRDADKANKIPLLFMRYNGLPKDFHFVAIEVNFAMELFSSELIDSTHYLKFMSKENKLFIFRSNDFFKMPYKELKLIAKTYLKNGSSKKSK